MNAAKKVSKSSGLIKILTKIIKIDAHDFLEINVVDNGPGLT